MNWRKAAVAIAVIGTSVIGIRAFAYKITPGNIFGLKVRRMVLIDNEKHTGFDQFGHALPTNDPQLTNTNTTYSFTYPTNRDVRMEIKGANAMRIRYGNEDWQGGTVDNGLAVFPFPINRTSNSTPYEMEVVTDDWKLIDTWDGRAPSKNFRTDPKQPFTPVWVSNLSNYTKDLAHASFKVEILPNSNPTQVHEWNSCEHYTELQAYHSDAHKPIASARLYIRYFHPFQSGFLAFGKLGNAKDVTPFDHSVKVIALGRGFWFPKDKYERWAPDGRPMQAEICDINHVQMATTPKGKRQVHIIVEVGEDASNVSVNVGKCASLYQSASWRLNPNDDGKTRSSLYVEFDPTLKTVDVPIRVGAGPYTELSRTSKFVEAKPGAEPSGSAAIQIFGGPTQKQIVGSVKVPVEYANEDLQIVYIGKDGREHGGISTSPTNGYIGAIVNEPDPSVDDFKTIILRGRKVRNYVFKNVHLSPN